MARPRTGSLIKRGKRGTYYLRYQLNGRLIQECLHTTIKSEAETARDKIMLPLQVANESETLQQVGLRIEKKKSELEILNEEKHPPTQFSNMWKTYLSSHNRPDSGEQTLLGYKSKQKLFIEWITEIHPDISEMRRVSTNIAEEYIDHLSSKNLSASTYNQHLNALALIWSVLAKKAKITHNPWAWDKATKSGIVRKSLNKEKQLRKKRALTPKELKDVLSHAKGDYHTLLMILLYTGQRLVDGVKLKWKNIDFDKGVISIMPQKTARRSAKMVYIPLLPQLRQELSSKFIHGKFILPELVECYDHDTGSAISKDLKAIFKAAKIETQIKGKSGSITKVGAHSFRHSFVTVARTAGLSDTVIQQITGHSSEEMVNHYTHFTPEIISRLAAGLPGNNEIPSKKLKAPTITNIKKIKSLVTKMDSNNWKSNRTKILDLLNS